MKIIDAIKEGETLLLENSKPKRLAAYFIKYLLKYSDIDIINNKEINNKQYKVYLNAIRKHIKGKPLQYITKEQEFFNEKIYVNKNVLIPRPETEYLVEKTINYINMYFKNPVIADICTGSGCIALALNSNIKNSTVYATDISRKALKVAKINTTSTDIALIKGDLLKPLIKNKIKIDVLISNPPYLTREDKIDTEVLKNEPHIALFGGLNNYKRIIKDSLKVINSRALIIFELQKSISNQVKEEALKVFPNAYISIEKDLANKERYIFIFINVDKK